MSRAASGVESFGESLRGALAGGAIDVVVGDQADRTRADGAGQNAASAERGDEVGGRKALQLKDDDVGLHAVEVDVDARQADEGFGEEACVGVVLGQARRHLFERNEAGSGQDARLAHAAAEGFAVDARLGDERAGADEHGADGCAETLGEAEHDGIEAGGERADVEAEMSRGIEDACAVEVGGQVAFADFVPDLFQDGQGSADAAAHVVGIFKRDEGGVGAETAAREDGWCDVVPGEDGVGRRDGAQLAAGKCGGGGHLPVEDVGAGFAENLLTGTGVEADGDLVAHGAGGDEDGGFAGEDFGGAAFEQIDGGIFAIDVIADDSLSHGGAHGGGGLGEGIAAEIDDGVGICGGGCVHGRSS